MNKNNLGKKGEEYCVEELEKLGYEIIDKNFHSPYGEIDIIAKEAQSLVFIEVKSRSKSTVDKTLWDITLSKQKKITKTAMFFLVNYNNPELFSYRFDVIIIKSDTDKNTGEKVFTLNHYKDAFYPPDVGDFFP